jgi:predicted nucleotidyltransferase
MNQIPYIKTITDKLVANINPLKIILFGSYAYGTQTSNSDIDICVVMNSTEKPVRRRINLSKLFLTREQPIDIIVYTPEELEQKLSNNDGFVREIVTNGEVLYDRS